MWYISHIIIYAYVCLYMFIYIYFFLYENFFTEIKNHWQIHLSFIILQ